MLWQHIYVLKKSEKETLKKGNFDWHYWEKIFFIWCIDYFTNLFSCIWLLWLNIKEWQVVNINKNVNICNFYSIQCMYVKQFIDESDSGNNEARSFTSSPSSFTDVHFVSSSAPSNTDVSVLTADEVLRQLTGMFKQS